MSKTSHAVYTKVALSQFLLGNAAWIFLTICLISIGDACHRHLLADCFVIYAGLKETKGHLSSNQERDESGPVVKFPVESGESIKGEKISLFHEKLGNVSQFSMSQRFPCEEFKLFEKLH